MKAELVALALAGVVSALVFRSAAWHELLNSLGGNSVNNNTSNDFHSGSNSRRRLTEGNIVCRPASRARSLAARRVFRGCLQQTTGDNDNGEEEFCFERAVREAKLDSPCQLVSFADERGETSLHELLRLLHERHERVILFRGDQSKRVGKGSGKRRRDDSSEESDDGAEADGGGDTDLSLARATTARLNAELDALAGSAGLEVSRGHFCPLLFAVTFRAVPAMGSLARALRGARGGLPASSLWSQLPSAGREAWDRCLHPVTAGQQPLIHRLLRRPSSGFARAFIANPSLRGGASPRLVEYIEANLGVNVTGFQEAQRLRVESQPPVLANDKLVPVFASSLEAALPILPLFEELVRFDPRLATVKAELTGDSPLHVAAREGLLSVINVLLELDSSSLTERNYFGQLPIHVAAASGHTPVFSLLMSRHPESVDVLCEKDRWGRSLAVYASYGLPAAELGQAHVCGDSVSDSSWTLTTPCASNDLKRAQGEWTETSSKWVTHRLDSVKPEARAPHVVCPDARWNHFLRDCLSIEFPCIIRGGALKWPASSLWATRDLGKVGRLVVQPVRSPHEHDYGSSRPAKRLQLSDFTGAAMEVDARCQDDCDKVPLDEGLCDCRPSYVFDGRMKDAIEPYLGKLPGNFSATHILSELIVGGRSSGSPPHTHGPAYNVLVFGQKKWWFWPPRDAHFVARTEGPGVVHVVDWLGAALPHLPADVEGEQLGGDIAFVPRNWGHAVVNLRESVSAAMEQE
jgi:Ankyrin repeats (3 copies)